MTSAAARGPGAGRSAGWPAASAQHAGLQEPGPLEPGSTQVYRVDLLIHGDLARAQIANSYNILNLYQIRNLFSIFVNFENEKVVFT